MREVISIHAGIPPARALRPVSSPDGEDQEQWGPSGRPHKVKIPPAIKEGNLWKCPQQECSFKTKQRTSYNNHHECKHSLSFKFICERCGAGMHKRCRYNIHAVTCKGSKISNSKRPGHPLKYVGQREIRNAHPVATEEAWQEQEAIIEQLTKENCLLKKQMQKKDQKIVKLKSLLEERERSEVLLSPLPVAIPDIGNPHLVDTPQVDLPLVEPPQVHPLLVDLPQVDPPLVQPLQIVTPIGHMRPRRETATLVDTPQVDLPLVEAPQVDPPLVDLPQVDPPLVQLLQKETPIVYMRPRRKTATLIREEEEVEMLSVLNDLDDSKRGIEVKTVRDNERAVFSVRDFHQGDFILEYVGKLLSGKQAYSMERIYEKDPSKGSFMYFFKSR